MTVVWTEEKLALLAKMHLAGKSDQEIAEHFGRSVYAIRSQRARLRLVGPALKRIDWDSADLTGGVYAVAQRYGVDKKSAKQAIVRRGATLRGSKT